MRIAKIRTNFLTPKFCSEKWMQRVIMRQWREKSSKRRCKSWKMVKCRLNTKKSRRERSSSRLKKHLYKTKIWRTCTRIVAMLQGRLYLTRLPCLAQLDPDLLTDASKTRQNNHKWPQIWEDREVRAPFLGCQDLELPSKNRQQYKLVCNKEKAKFLDHHKQIINIFHSTLASKRRVNLNLPNQNHRMLIISTKRTTLLTNNSSSFNSSKTSLSIKCQNRSHSAPMFSRRVYRSQAWWII